MSGKTILISAVSFSLGAGIGGIIGAFLTKKKCDAELNKYIDDMNKEYDDLYDKFVMAVGDVNPEEEFDDLEDGEEDQEDEEDEDDYEPENDIHRSEKINKKTSYSSFYKVKGDSSKGPTERIEDYDENDGIDPELINEPPYHRKPKIISSETAAALPAPTCSQCLLYFPDSGGVITDEEENIILAPEYLIGDALDKYDFRNSDEKVIFVMNYDLNTCYEIDKMSGMCRDHFDAVEDGGDE